MASDVAAGVASDVVRRKRRMVKDNLVSNDAIKATAVAESLQDVVIRLYDTRKFSRPTGGYFLYLLYLLEMCTAKDIR